MKNFLIAIKNSIILLYILNILVQSYLSKYINENIIKIVDIINQRRYISEFTNNKKLNKYSININFDKDKDKDIGIKDRYLEIFTQKKMEKENVNHNPDHDNKFSDDEEEERRRQEIFNITTQIRELDDKIDVLNTEITKRKIYAIFLGILTIILFLMLVIYCSIKCYIICTKKHLEKYRVSYICENKLGEVYIDENGEEQLNFSMKNKDECEAPIYSKSNIGQNFSTFNPDYYKASDGDINLYKPYNNEDIQ